MRTVAISIIPIEFFTIRQRQNVEKALQDRDAISTDLDDANIYDLFNEISPYGSSIYSVSIDYCDNAKIAFSESSACIVIDKELDDFCLDEDSIRNELIRRQQYHKNIIDRTNDSSIGKLINEILQHSDTKTCPITINYVFSFYVIHNNTDITSDERQIAKILSEPSLIDIDDMISSSAIENKSARCSAAKQKVIDKIIDVDAAASAETYITWATIVSICTDEITFQRTKNLLTALEIRLQCIWNRCFSLSQFIETVFDQNKTLKNIEELYWSFARTLDDAKSVLSSTFSTRASNLFDEMIRTSKLRGEIDRLQLKVDLLEKFVEQKAIRNNRKYQKIIELLLFVTALASLAQLLMPVPILSNSVASWGIVGGAALIGLFAIIRAR